MKSHRVAVVLVAAAAVLAVSISGAAARIHARHHVKVAAATHGACLLTGTASFSPGLKATASSQSYTFSGSFSSCKGVSGITGGSVTASGSGSLGCGNGSSSGTALVSWSNGTSSTIPITTTSAAAVTVVKGTVSSGTFAGLASKAVIVFSTSTPQKCAVGGLPSANFEGPAEIGT